MKEPENIAQSKDKFFNGHNLDRDEVGDLLQYIKEMEVMLEESSNEDGKNRKQSSSGDGFVKYGQIDSE